MSNSEDQTAEWTEDPDLAFEAGVWAAMNLWDTLDLIRDNEWAGRNTEDRVDELYNKILDLFEENEDIEVHELEDFLNQTLLDVFNTDAQDGTPAWMARLLYQMRKDVFIRQDFAGILKLQAEVERRQNSNHRVEARGDGEPESDDDDEDDYDDENEEHNDADDAIDEDEEHMEAAAARRGKADVKDDGSDDEVPAAVPAQSEEAKVANPDGEEWEVVGGGSKKKGKGKAGTAKPAAPSDSKGPSKHKDADSTSKDSDGSKPAQ